MQAHEGDDNAMRLARYVVELHLNSEVRLLNLENEIRKFATDRRENVKDKEYVFEEKLFKDQYKFNKNVHEHIDGALHYVRVKAVYNLELMSLEDCDHFHLILLRYTVVKAVHLSRIK